MEELVEEIPKIQIKLEYNAIIYINNSILTSSVEHPVQ